MTASPMCPVLRVSLLVAFLCLAGVGGAQDRVAREAAEASPNALPEASREGIPAGVTQENFSDLREHSPFLRTVGISGTLILTGLARIEDQNVVTLVDRETRESYSLAEGEIHREGWELVEVKGDPTDVETLTAKVKLAGTSEVVSIRYEKGPPPVVGRARVTVSRRIGDGSAGGGTGPHGGPDPRVLTPDQMADARNAARNIRAGFQADGYADGQAIPREVVSKLERLSPQVRENINVKMFEYRNRGLGMQERQRIYNGLLDRAVRAR